MQGFVECYKNSWESGSLQQNSFDSKEPKELDIRWDLSHLNSDVYDISIWHSYFKFSL